MAALDILKKDHAKVKKLLEQIAKTQSTRSKSSSTAGKRRETLFAKVKEELQLHEKVEEEIFYPQLKEFTNAKPLVLKAYEAHQLVDNMIEELDKLDYNDEVWMAKFEVLHDNVLSHIKEEESVIFKTTKSLLNKFDLETLDKQLQKKKKELKKASNQ